LSLFNKIYFSVTRKLWYLLNKSRFKSFGENSYFKKPLIITPSVIIVRDNVFVSYNSRIEGIVTYADINYSPEIILDSNCSIQQNVHITCANRIYIGKYTAIASNVTITDIHHPYNDINIPIENQKLIVSSVSIGDGCKINNNVVILPGTAIGRHCTVGANSVVNGNIPDYCVVVGMPGRIVKRYNFEKKEWLKTDKEGNFKQ
jgi:acetyltransferase-like isoleucine patch superfamily enzyme